MNQKSGDIAERNNLNIVLDTFEDSDTFAECVEAKNMYDAYILDIEMPNLSGVNLAEKIREYSECAYIIPQIEQSRYVFVGQGNHFKFTACTKNYS